MLKNLLNLEGVKSLSKSQQKTIVGGIGDGGSGGPNDPGNGSCLATCSDGHKIPIYGGVLSMMRCNQACYTQGGASSCWSFGGSHCYSS
ncbi:hypothetical protein SAMN04487989_1011044 [Bizionia echini]|uniref:Uncharacterized protein n=1 Tax=Bizionia echini TaxID=649333 RepID=A0A1I4ZSE9_9FLAO|nr:hypothetical protein [Bizionia echini]SFN53196.1 hypothetical protein SAMN04487989_1011044 [Bizionia echini]